MEIDVRLFANLNKYLPAGLSGRRLRLTVPQHTTIAGLLNHLSIPRRAVHLVAVNGRHQQDETYVLSDGDTVSIFPPLIGGAQARVGPFLVGPDPVDVMQLQNAVADPAAGAVVTFVGVVRDHSRGKSIRYLEYEAYADMAQEVLAQIAAEMAQRWELRAVAMTHRVGRLAVGEASIGVAVSAAHRQEAFAACAYAMDRIKEILPVWKKEHAADGAWWVEGPGDYRKTNST